MAKTTNYQWDLPNPYGASQIIETTKTASAFDEVDSKIKAFEDAYLAHEHAFGELTGRPTTLAGYGITDGMTADEVADAIRQAVDGLVNGSGTALDTLKELADALGNDPNFAGTVSTALGFRLRVDAAQPFTLAQKAQGRSNLDALGTADKGQANGVASLDSTGKVPSGQLPALTTTATVGAAMAGANSKETPDDGDFLGGVLADGSTMFKIPWGKIKAAFTAIVKIIVGGDMAGRAYPRRADGQTINFNGAAALQENPPALIGGGWGGNFNNFYFYTTTSLTVGWANGATYADRLGNNGWTLNDIISNLNWRVTDTRFNGYIEQDFNIPETGSFQTIVPGAPGYVVAGIWTWGPGRHLTCSFRQPQIYIPNAGGWRPLGTW
ncbi:hypothetical protein BR10RB9215_C11504 [Brucella sp. 10RB9215]|uniref:hypothetical protein n=1 Tax=unclassified Brucella TaxID=2632610 RepID=UPI00090C71FE|nr:MULTISPECIES: hypothetical protein [unclassified Brucella]UWF58458.1 hypothetical protein NYO66_07725 [Brucella sp. 2716]SBW14666.1 hypothetical protein BR10RB9215_C11504 [Brucella sp. 10RB9215]